MHKLTPLLVGILVTGVVLAAMLFAGSLEHQRQLEHEYSVLLNLLSNTRGRLESSLNTRLHLVQGLVALVETDRNFTEEQFQKFAAGLASVQPGIRSLQLAPSAVVKYVYPRSGNEGVVGHDLLADPARSLIVKKAIAEKKFFITGPVTLLQGGEALIGRWPIYLADPLHTEKFWGFASILLDVEPLFKEAGLLNPPEGVSFALRGKNGTGAAGEIFFGTAETFAGAPLLLPVTLPEGSWQLAALPSVGWQRSWSQTPWFWGGGLLLAVAWGVTAFLLLVRKQQLKEQNIQLANGVAERTEALSQLQLRLQNSIDSMTSALISVDPEERIVGLNQAAKDYLGEAADGATGASLAERFPVLTARLRELQNSAESAVLEKIPFDKLFSGVRRHFEVSVYPLKGMAAGSRLLKLDDMTERVRMQDFVIQNEKMLSVGGLAAGMAHEINNPLAGILQNLQLIEMRLLQGSPKNEQTAAACDIDLAKLQNYLQQRNIGKIVDNIRDAGIRAAKIVDNMLSFSRQESFYPQENSLVKLVQSTLELVSKDFNLKQKYDFRQVATELLLDPDLPLVPCDASQIQQVLFNLLKNATQAMHEWTERPAPPKIVIRLYREAQWGCLELTDNGPGMTEETKRRIFEPFFTTKTVGVGTGLGLSVCYFIVTENHHGRFEVYSEPGYGARFVIKLPLDWDLASKVRLSASVGGSNKTIQNQTEQQQGH